MMKRLLVTVASIVASGLLAGCAGFDMQVPSRFLGEVVSPQQAERTVQIGPDTRYVHVKQFETVRFVGGGQQFGFRFDGPQSVRSFDLQRVAPGGMLGRPVFAEIELDTRYLGSDRSN
ncbi:MAG: CzcE family metal-binding protein [Lautropia sp.]